MSVWEHVQPAAARAGRDERGEEEDHHAEEERVKVGPGLLASSLCKAVLSRGRQLRTDCSKLLFSPLTRRLQKLNRAPSPSSLLSLARARSLGLLGLDLGRLVDGRRGALGLLVERGEHAGRRLEGALELARRGLAEQVDLEDLLEEGARGGRVRGCA